MEGLSYWGLGGNKGTHYRFECLGFRVKGLGFGFRGYIIWGYVGIVLASSLLNTSKFSSWCYAENLVKTQLQDSKPNKESLTQSGSFSASGEPSFRQDQLCDAFWRPKQIRLCSSYQTLEPAGE